MRISDWSSDVCSSDLRTQARRQHRPPHNRPRGQGQELTPSPAPAQNIRRSVRPLSPTFTLKKLPRTSLLSRIRGTLAFAAAPAGTRTGARTGTPVSSSANSSVSKLIARSEEHTSELQSLMRISYAVFCLKKKKKKKQETTQ